MKSKVFGLLIWSLLRLVESYFLDNDCPPEGTLGKPYFRYGLYLFDIQQSCPRLSYKKLFDCESMRDDWYLDAKLARANLQEYIDAARRRIVFAQSPLQMKIHKLTPRPKHPLRSKDPYFFNAYHYLFLDNSAKEIEGYLNRIFLKLTLLTLGVQNNNVNDVVSSSSFPSYFFFFFRPSLSIPCSHWNVS